MTTHQTIAQAIKHRPLCLKEISVLHPEKTYLAFKTELRRMRNRGEIEAVAGHAFVNPRNQAYAQNRYRLAEVRA